jgi:hypothetical protein
VGLIASQGAMSSCSAPATRPARCACSSSCAQRPPYRARERTRGQALLERLSEAQRRAITCRAAPARRDN